LFLRRIPIRHRTTTSMHLLGNMLSPSGHDPDMVANPSFGAWGALR
jgi:hypothetical protein